MRFPGPARPLATLLLGTALVLAACGGTPEREEPLPGLPRGPTLELPDDWRTMPIDAFERWALEALPNDCTTPLTGESLDDLARALDEVARAFDEAARPLDDQGLDPLAVRAAVILGRSRYPSSATELIRRLEQRELGPERHSDCGDTLAAAALARYPDPRRYAQRLVPLAVGSNPHPDLEVRVECAATALHAGYPEVVPFLVQVLRIDTPAGSRDRRDFAVSPTTAWARGRAAEALYAAAGLPLAYRHDGSMQHREEEAARIEAVFAEAAARAAESEESAR
jgi:hypothetical protein